MDVNGDMGLYPIPISYVKMMKMWDRAKVNGTCFKYLFIILDCCYANEWGE